ncbi:MAG: hypothetical protein H6585_14810 [Flavobacteriales bacterium]|nr:hypothetical protein [Flavobacteriales bacterium]MCB9449601.1 hypothetical protein [Flavobacteriales bacterium]
MDILEQIVASLAKEELRFLKIYLTRTRPGKDRRDVTLLNALRRSGGEPNTVGGKQNNGKQNAHYRLRNRLVQEIGKSLVLQNQHASDFNAAFHYLLLARHFKSKMLSDVAVFFLRKAERKAREQSLHETLDMIYNEFISISDEALAVNPEHYIELRKKNWSDLLRAREFDDILAVVRHRIKKAQNFSVEKDAMVHLLRKVTDEYGEQKELQQTPAFNFRMYRSISRLLMQQNQFKALADYLTTTLATFRKQKWLSGENKDVEIEMLIYLANAHIKEKNYTASLTWAKELKSILDRQGKSLQEKYLFNYFNILVNNYSHLDLDKAIAILEDIKKNKVISKQPFHVVYTYLNLALSYHGKGQHKKAISSIATMVRQNGFEKLDKAFRLKISVLEGIIRYEAQDWELVHYRMNQVQREFKHLLSHEELAREKAMVSLLKTGGGNGKVTQRIRQNVRVVLSISDDQAETQDLINYNLWVRHSFGNMPSFQ